MHEEDGDPLKKNPSFFEETPVQISTAGSAIYFDASSGTEL